MCLRGCLSDWIDITSGVPQGSVLGPVLFIAYVNDLPDSVLSSLFMFADDTKLYRAITSEFDCDILQHDLDNIADWGRTWLTNFNQHKCNLLPLELMFEQLFNVMFRWFYCSVDQSRRGEGSWCFI